MDYALESSMQRSTQQNKSLHLYFEHLASELNDAGLDMRKTLKPAVEIPWSAQTVKEYIWRPIMQAQLGKRSTTELETTDIDLVFNTITRHLANRFGLEVEFPSMESLSLKELMKEL